MSAINQIPFALTYKLNITEKDAPLLRLPVEVIHQILCKLDIQSITVCSLVCRNLYVIIIKDNLWTKLYARDFPSDSPLETIDFYQNYKNSQLNSKLIKSNLINGRYALQSILSQLRNISTIIVRDGKIFVGSYDGRIEIYNMKTSEYILVPEEKSVHCVDTWNEMLFLGHSDGTIGVLDLEKNQRKYPFIGHSAQIQSLVFSRSQLFSGSSDHTIRIWNPSTRECLRILEHTEEIAYIAVLDSQIFSKSINHTVKVWDADNAHAECLSFYNRHAFLVFNKELFLANEKTIEIYDPNKGEQLGVLSGHKSMIISLFTIEKMLFSSDDLGKTMIWDFKTRKCLKKLSFFWIGRFSIVGVPPIIDGKILLPTLSKNGIKFFDYKASPREVYKTIIHLLEYNYLEGIMLFKKMPQVEREKIYELFAPIYGVELENAKETFENGEDIEKMIQAIEGFLSSFTG